MKGLLYKDFCVVWKQMKFVLIMVAIFCLAPGISANLGKFFVLYGSLMIPVSLLAYDERAKWNTLASMLPFSTLDLVLSKYICSWLCTAFAAVMYVLGLCLSSPSHIPTAQDLSSLLLVIACSFLFQAIYFPVLFRMGTERGRFAMILIVLGTAILSALLFEVFFSNAQFPSAILVPALLLIGVLLCLGSLPVSVKQYRAQVQ